MNRLLAVAAGVAVALVLGGCSAPQPFPTPTPTASESAASTGDGVLRIGTLFPMSGDISSIGPAMVAAVEVAVRDINAAGGVLGQPVEVFFRDSGDIASDRLETAFADLVARGVDVVIGPATSALAERLLPLADEAGVVVISPAATDPIARESGPTDVFFRTIATTDQQAVGIVETIAGEGGDSVALITSGDAIGRSFELAARAAIDRAGLRLTSIDQLDAATNIDRLAFSVVSDELDAVILATGAPLAAQNQALISALAARGVSGDQFWLSAQTLADYSTSIAPGVLEGANGVLEGRPASDELLQRLRQSDPAVVTARFAPETYDAVVLAAVAAVLADDDGGASVAAFLRQASGQGVPCASFGECIDVLSTEPAVDYEGLSGALTFDESGDIADGSLGRYHYTAVNLAERVGDLEPVSR